MHFLPNYNFTFWRGESNFDFSAYNSLLNTLRETETFLQHIQTNQVSLSLSVHGDNLFPPTQSGLQCYTAVFWVFPPYIILGIASASLLRRALFPESVFSHFGFMLLFW